MKKKHVNLGKIEFYYQEIQNFSFKIIRKNSKTNQETLNIYDSNFYIFL